MTDIVSQELLEREYWLYIHQAAVTWLWMSANVDLACAGCVNGQSQLMQVYPCEEVLSFSVWLCGLWTSDSQCFPDVLNYWLFFTESGDCGSLQLGAWLKCCRIKRRGGKKKALCFCFIQVLLPPTRLQGIYAVVKICPVSFSVPPWRLGQQAPCRPRSFLWASTTQVPCGALVFTVIVFVVC